MRAISLWEPWATAIAIGAKTIETRHWATQYRGTLAIHAAKTRSHIGCVLSSPEVKAAFAAAGIHSSKDLNFGCVVATCHLERCVPTEEIRDSLPSLERQLGGYEDGRFAWVLSDIKRLPQPIAALGRQGFWKWGWNVANDTLFDLPRKPSRKRADRRLETAAIRARHGIWTHYAKGCGWLAMAVRDSLAALDGYKLSEEEKTSPIMLYAGYGRLINEAGLSVDGEKTELAACRKLLTQMEERGA